jgi:hypothetical protein
MECTPQSSEIFRVLRVLRGLTAESGITDQFARGRTQDPAASPRAKSA